MRQPEEVRQNDGDDRQNTTKSTDSSAAYTSGHTEPPHSQEDSFYDQCETNSRVFRPFFVP
jgi:hypothetical protein